MGPVFLGGRVQTNVQAISAYDVIYDVVPNSDVVEKQEGSNLDVENAAQLYR